MEFYIVRLVDTYGVCTKMEANVMPCFFIQQHLIQAFAYMNVKSQRTQQIFHDHLQGSDTLR